MAPFTATREVAGLMATLAAEGTPDRARHERAYLKSELDFLGTSVPAIRRTARRWWRAHPDLTRPQLWAVVNALWRTSVHECWQVGTSILECAQRLLGPEDVPRIERLLRRAQSWAHVDWLATGVMAPLLWRTPSPQRQLRRWAADESFWIRRTALLCHLPRLRTHPAALESFLTLAEPMLEEREFFIRKAIGWVLRDAAKRQPAVVQAFVERVLPRLSGVTFREAVKYLPARDRAALTRAFQARRGRPATSVRPAPRSRPGSRARRVQAPHREPGPG